MRRRAAGARRSPPRIVAHAGGADAARGWDEEEQLRWTAQRQLAELQVLQLDDATDRFIVWSMEPQARQLTFSKTGPRFVELSLVAHARGSFQSYQNERRVRFRLQRVLSIDAGGEVWVDEPGLYAVDAIIEGEDPRPSAYVDIK